MHGYRSHDTPDKSKNSWIANIVTMGEGWHNNHHAFPASASFGLEWYRLDPGYWFIQLLEVFHLAWDVKVPTTEKIQSRELNA
jgi:stearoyl-CoA desaturase (delta-9 desaturase)